MTYREVIIAMRGSNHQFELTEQFAWERARWQTTLLLNVHTAKGKSLKPTDLLVFPWEQTNKPEIKRKLTASDKSIFDTWDKEA